MATINYPIVVEANRDFYLPVNLTSSLGNPANLSSYLCMMTVKKAVTDTDANALYKSAPWSQNLPFGSFTFKISRTQNKGWYLMPPSGSGPISTTIVYDVSVQDAAAVPNWTTLMTGPVSVVAVVTQSIP
jgi:hypothetical protein